MSSLRHWIAAQTVIGSLLRSADRIRIQKEIKDKMSGFTDCEKFLNSPSALQQDEKPQTRTPRASLQADPVPGCPQELCLHRGGRKDTMLYVISK